MNEMHPTILRRVGTGTRRTTSIDESIVEKMVRQHGDQFSILFRLSDAPFKNFYDIPYCVLRPLMTEDSLTNDKDGRRRWVLDINTEHEAKFSRTSRISVSEYWGRRFLNGQVDPAGSQVDPVEDALDNAVREVLIRRTQSKFRRKVLENFRGRCALTGVADPALLNAGHIIPWSEPAGAKLRTDVANGILLAPLEDRLFDRGYMTFTNDLKVVVTTEKYGEAAKDLLAAYSGRQIEEPVTPLAHEALEFHRTHVFDFLVK